MGPGWCSETTLRRPTAGLFLAQRPAMRLVLALAVAAAVSCSAETSPPSDDSTGETADELAPGQSRRAVITCDFGKAVQDQPFQLGKMEFDIDLDSTAVKMRCLDGRDECAFGGEENVFRLLTFEGSAGSATFARSEEDESSVQRIIVTEEDITDAEMTAVLSWFSVPFEPGVRAEAMLLVHTGAAITFASDIAKCSAVVP